MSSRAARFRLSGWVALAATLYVAIGIHAFHPLIHPAGAPTGCGSDTGGGDIAALHLAQGDQAAPGVVPSHAHCSVCEFLACFHPAAPEPVRSDAILERLSSVRVPARWAEPSVPALRASSPRAPPFDIQF